ncbi:MAG: molecular chaperone DnaJ, partial [Micrococcales bacterium]|nr:molecular chaperone DnaJ [Micrococcales bacterium]
GNRIRLAGQGEAGLAGGPNGDLYLEIEVKRHKDFVRQGDNLTCRLHLPMTAAALGASLQINTFDGSQAVNLLPGTQSGDVVTLTGLGVGRLRGRGRGDLQVTVVVEVPTGLNAEQTALMQELARLRGEEQPEAVLANNSGGFFSRLKDAFGSK